MGFLERASSEYRYLAAAIRMLRRVTPIARRRTWTFPDTVADVAARFGDRPALVGPGASLTYRELDALANRYARWAVANGVRQGDAVCLLMPNRVDYPAVWIGIARAGGVTALLNTHQTGAALAHSINIVEPRHVIVAAGLAGNYRSAVPELRPGARLWLHGEGGGEGERIDLALAGLSGAPLPPGERPELTLEDKCIYIYTSGTTGLPKAANVNHYRVQVMVHGFSAAMKATPRDRIYVCLPLYHSAGGVVGIGTCLSVGGSVQVAERFSARDFWDDVADHGCTIFQYVGEICRYLVNAPPHPKERAHRLRLAAGNGLRPDIWERFRDRFDIPHILEYYGATEGNVAIFNFDDTPGSVGRIAAWAKHRFPFEIVRFDIAAGAPVRGPDGFCVRAETGEVGELVAEILDDPRKPAQRFQGYVDRAATSAKIVRDVFRPGDAWFRTGDLLRKDALGYHYFIDRVGDTFRWKGENVATSEVAETINQFHGVRESVVYGVAVPGHEGRAGMASLVAAADLDLAGLRLYLHDRLPPYARPLFLRIRQELDHTTTHKQRRLKLVEEGFDPAGIADRLYFDHPETGRLEPLGPTLHAEIAAGGIRL